MMLNNFYVLFCHLCILSGDLSIQIFCQFFNCAQSLSHIQLFAAPWTAAHQALLSMGFSRQEYWSGLPFSPPGDLPDSGIEPTSPAWQADSLLLSHQNQLKTQIQL